MNVEGQMHWAVKLSNMRVRHKRPGLDAQGFTFRSPVLKGTRLHRFSAMMLMWSLGNAWARGCRRCSWKVVLSEDTLSSKPSHASRPTRRRLALCFKCR